jgi:hypothetical protein
MEPPSHPFANQLVYGNGPLVGHPLGGIQKIVVNINGCSHGFTSVSV